MTDIVCKCGVSRLEDVQCAECGEYFKAGWIPVSERLPEVKGRYICSIMYKEEPKKIWVEQRYWDGYGWDMYTSIVTHWMPLPPPPQEAE